MRYSHPDHMGRQLHAVLQKLRYEDQVPVSVLARMAGCSESLIYTWSDVEQCVKAPARYVLALGAALASEYRNYRVINLLMPLGSRVVTHEPGADVDGRIDDEVADGTLAFAALLSAHRGRNPEAMAEAREMAREVLKRAEGEEALLRQSAHA